MAQRVEKFIIGVDVSKEQLDLHVLTTDQLVSISNDTESIEQWLDSSPGPVCLAIEPTNIYHLGIANAAHARGHEDFLITVGTLNADLSIVKTNGSNTFQPGKMVTWEIVVDNPGAVDVTGVLVQDPVPMRIINPQWSCATSACHELLCQWRRHDGR